MPNIVEGAMLAFVPVFVAIDALGVLPIYMGLAQKVGGQRRRKFAVQALITALGLCVFFLFLGQAVFRLLGITLYDFMVAGGIVLFGIALVDLISAGTRHNANNAGFGVVPLGTPLIAGPALLTTTLMMAGQVGDVATLLAIVLNLALTGAIFLASDVLYKIMGDAGARAASKVAHLLLAAIAVMMVRKGLMGMLLK